MWALPGPRGAVHDRVMLWLEADRMTGGGGGPGRTGGREGAGQSGAGRGASSRGVLVEERASGASHMLSLLWGVRGLSQPEVWGQE